MEVILLPAAKNDLEFWRQSGSVHIKERISRLLAAIKEDYQKGIGHPEPLKGNLSGCWSRRIDKQNRLIYQPVEEREHILILSLRGHYADK